MFFPVHYWLDKCQHLDGYSGRLYSKVLAATTEEEKAEKAKEAEETEEEEAVVYLAKLEEELDAAEQMVLNIDRLG